MQLFWICSTTIYPEKKVYEKYWKWKDIQGKNSGEKKMKVDFPLHFAASERNKHNLSSVDLISPISFMLTTGFLHLFQSDVKWNASAFRSLVQERSVLYYNIGKIWQISMRNTYIRFIFIIIYIINLHIAHSPCLCIFRYIYIKKKTWKNKIRSLERRSKWGRYAF